MHWIDWIPALRSWQVPAHKVSASSCVVNCDDGDWRTLLVTVNYRAVKRYYVGSAQKKKGKNHVHHQTTFLIYFECSLFCFSRTHTHTHTLGQWSVETQCVDKPQWWHPSKWPFGCARSIKGEAIQATSICSSCVRRRPEQLEPLITVSSALGSNRQRFTFVTITSNEDKDRLRVLLSKQRAVNMEVTSKSIFSWPYLHAPLQLHYYDVRIK